MAAISDMTNNGKDRISNLPFTTLGEILSYLTTKEAVRTSVLSEQWRLIWTFSSCIDIDDSIFSGFNGQYTTLEHKECFIHFVDRVLRLNVVSNLRNFSLSCYQEYEPFCQWISTLTIRHAEKVCIQFGGELYIELPSRLFTCKNLVTMKLYGRVVLNVPPSVCLPSLKTLHLLSVYFSDESSMKKLIAGCPFLEDLFIDREFYPDETTYHFHTLHIQSLSIKSLRIYLHHNDNYRLAKTFRIFIDAKNLEQLQISDYVTEHFDVNNLSSLVSVWLDVTENTSGSAETTVELLRKMHNTKFLILSADTMRCLGSALLNNLPTFHYLTHLEVEMFPFCWHVLPYILDCSPNLITFDFDFDQDIDCEDIQEAQVRPPKYLMLHLESITIKGFNWSKDEIEMVSYLLKNATILKKMHIHIVAMWTEDLYKELSTLPRSSTTCELVILYHGSVKKIVPSISEFC